MSICRLNPLAAKEMVLLDLFYTVTMSGVAQRLSLKRVSSRTALTANGAPDTTGRMRGSSTLES